MRRPLPELLHDLANRMQAASAAAALLDPAAAANPSDEAALRGLLDELQVAITIVQTMRREFDAAVNSQARSA